MDKQLKNIFNDYAEYFTLQLTERRHFNVNMHEYQQLFYDINLPSERKQ